MKADEKAIAAVVAKYQAALNQSSTVAVMKLYTSDAVYLPPYSLSSVGVQAIREAYDAVFDAIELNFKFEIAEIQQLASNWAFARTNSAGSVKVKETGESCPERNQELFVFQNFRGDWKIALYSFSPANPPAQW